MVADGRGGYDREHFATLERRFSNPEDCSSWNRPGTVMRAYPDVTPTRSRCLFLGRKWSGTTISSRLRWPLRGFCREIRQEVGRRA